MGKFKKALDTNSNKAFVDSESKVADDAGISGTPAFVINGYFISGAQPFPKFKKIIDKALKEGGEKPADKKDEKKDEKAADKKPLKPVMAPKPAGKPADDYQ